MKLVNHIEMPTIGLGVYKMEAGTEMNTAIANAYQAGYRLFDTAQMYQNEGALGEALKLANIPRENIFLISKVNNGNQWYGPTLDSLYITLDKLQTSYLDSFLIHWPGQNTERTISTWEAMEEAYQKGLVKSIGVCNFEIGQLKFLLSHCRIPPMINQIEHTPLLHDEELLSFCKAHNIQVMAWGPLLRGDLDNTVIRSIAEKYHKSPAQILIRWNIQQGIIPIPKSKNVSRLIENISVFDFELEEKDIERMNQMNQNRRTSFDPLTFDF